MDNETYPRLIFIRWNENIYLNIKIFISERGKRKRGRLRDAKTLISGNTGAIVYESQNHRAPGVIGATKGAYAEEEQKGLRGKRNVGQIRVERRNTSLPAWCTLRAHLSLRVFIARRVFDLASVCYAL